ncbi:MAG: DUF6600 domain-containing protein [Thermodesulfobacteriota bacterium]
MKYKILFMIIFSILFLPSLSQSSSLELLRISLIEGDVQIWTEETEEWVPASMNMPLKETDRIWVPEEGRVELQLKEGSLIRLDETSAFEILTLEMDSFQFYLIEGRAYINYRGLKDKVLQIDTPLSSLRIYEKARLRIDVSREGSMDISVYKGKVFAETREGRTRVSEGNRLSLQDGRDAEIYTLEPPDEWERWNRERDRRLSARRPPPHYLPEELHPYAYEFEENGRWIYVREYGYVWTPTVIVSVGWAPYRIGRWVWIRGDYVWISYEPWGWVPYHYGRWAFVVNIGWCWVPPPRGAVFWGPGFVGWIHTPHYVSWVPLAPGEIYFGYGHYGPHSVNVTKIDIKQVEIHKVVYKNIRVHNGITVVHRENFIKGKHEPLKLKENLFLRERISFGRPNIRPERETKIPIIKEIPQSKRPPEPVREIRIMEIKQKRPLVRKQEISVLETDYPPKEMKLKYRERKHLRKEGEKIEIKGPDEKEALKSQRGSEKTIEKPRPLKKSELLEKGPQEKGSPPISLEERKAEKPNEAIPIGKGQKSLKEYKPIEKGWKPESMEKEGRMRDLKPSLILSFPPLRLIRR